MMMPGPVLDLEIRLVDAAVSVSLVEEICEKK